MAQRYLLPPIDHALQAEGCPQFCDHTQPRTHLDYLAGLGLSALYGRLNIPRILYAQVYHPCPAPNSGSFAAMPKGGVPSLSPSKTPSRLHLKHGLPLTAGEPGSFAAMLGASMEVQGQHRGPQLWCSPQLRRKAKALAKRADRQG